MELEIYQVAILLTMLFSGCDTRPFGSRKTLTVRRSPLFNGYQRSLPVRKVAELAFEEQPRPVTSRIERESVPQKPNTTEKKTVNHLADLIVNRRHRRYVKQGSRWHVKNITWRIDNWSAKLSNSAVKNTLSKAFRIWAEVCPLRFSYVDPPATAIISVEFVTGNHGDNNDFDGPGGYYGHAYYPNNTNYRGEIHFDDEEPWTTSTATVGERSLFRAAVHEIGHSLGLKHSNVANSIMSGSVNLLGGSVTLDDDDVAGIQSIYGKCRPKVQAITSWVSNGKTYIFNGDFYWRFNDIKHESERGYPLYINQGWGKVPDDPDELVVWGHNDVTYIFKGHEYWAYHDDSDQTYPGYPKNIASGWPGLPASGIDAGVTHNDGVTYFFKDDQVYKYDNYIDAVASGYPKAISSEWPGVPNYMDGAFRWEYDGNTYFFRDEYYWQWNDTTNYVNNPGLIGIDGFKNLCNV